MRLYLNESKKMEFGAELSGFERELIMCVPNAVLAAGATRPQHVEIDKKLSIFVVSGRGILYNMYITKYWILKRDYAEEGFNGRTKRADNKARTEDN
ncbi:MAG: hypothetical protein PUD90_04615 [Clostridia bacterium]|nr:hypothetical protein [Clostridia bacterium]